VEAARRPRITAEPIEAPPMPRELDARRLVRRGLVVVAALVALGLVALLAPGLGEVRTLLGRASPGWLLLAVALEVGSSLSYVAMFRPAFCERMSWRSTIEISLSELAVGSIVPASGAGGVALGAWFLTRSGMPVQVVARRSIAFLLVKSSVNFAAVVVLGVLLWLGVGPELSPLLTILPAGLAAATIVGVPLAASWLANTGARHASGRLRSVAVAIRDGVGEAGRLLRRHDAMLVWGAIGYWIFDNLVLLATFHAFGLSPPVMVVLMAYLIGQIGGVLPLPGGLGGIDGGLIGALIVYGVDPAGAAAAVLAYRVILFWIPLVMGVPAFWSLRRGLNDQTRPDLCLPIPAASSVG
jgi:uncharacterized membrane protein YbhN (UPF0104 family)